MKKIFKILGIVFTFVVIWYYFIQFNKVLGNPPAPLKSGQLLISDRVTFLLRDPQFRDVVVFDNGNGAEFVGIVDYVADHSDPKPYKVVSKEGGDQWQLAKYQITKHVWFPSYNMSFND